MPRAFGAAVLCAALISAGLLGPATPRAGAAETCGVERWAVKTLSDPAADNVNYTARHVSVRHLRRLPKQNVGYSTPRIRPYEYRTFSIHVRLRLAALEDDRDVHLVVSQPHHRHRTMILEFPNVHCNGAASSIKKAAMRRARRRFVAACGPIGTSFKRFHGRAIVKGVAFFDINHGQTGVAPNAIELHPVLRFRPRGSCTH